MANWNGKIKFDASRWQPFALRLSRKRTRLNMILQHDSIETRYAVKLYGEVMSRAVMMRCYR